MSNLFTQLNQTAQQQRETLEKSRSREIPDDSQNEIPSSTPKTAKIEPKVPNDSNVSSHNEPTSSHVELTKSKGKKEDIIKSEFDNKLMTQIIKELSLSKENYSTTLRLTQEEKKFIEDFIHGDLRRKDIDGYSVSKSKLMRYSFAYVLLRHRKEFTSALTEALKEENKIGLLT